MAMNIEVNHRFRELEARIKALEDKLNAAPQVSSTEMVQKTVSEPVDLHSSVPAAAAPTRKMCPKCGVKPNHFFHVRKCGQQEKEKNGEDANSQRDPGQTL